MGNKEQKIELIEQSIEGIKTMSEIKEYLINMFNGANYFAKERIKILLSEDVVTRARCGECGNKFVPNMDDETGKSSIKMYNDNVDDLLAMLQELKS